MSQGHILKDVSIYFKGSLLLCFWGTIFILFGPTHLVLFDVRMWKKNLLKSQTSLIQLKLSSAVDQFFFLQQKGKLPFVVCHPPLFLWMIFWTKNIVGGKCSCCCVDSKGTPLWKSPISRSYLPIYELCWKTPYKIKNNDC